MVLNHAQTHLKGNFQKVSPICFYLILFFVLFLFFLFFEAHFLSSLTEQLGRTAPLSWNSLPSGYK